MVAVRPCELLRSVSLQIINGLNSKRSLVEKELLSFGKAPKGIKDIFHQCRNFERAYARALEVRAGSVACTCCAPVLCMDAAACSEPGTNLG